MTEDEFLASIYASISVGDSIEKPRSTSEVLDIAENGDISYQIGVKNKKAVTRCELRATYRALRIGALRNYQLNQITTSAKPCNVTTIKWLITIAGLARENVDKTYTRLW